MLSFDSCIWIVFASYFSYCLCWKCNKMYYLLCFRKICETHWEVRLEFKNIFVLVYISACICYGNIIYIGNGSYTEGLKLIIKYVIQINGFKIFHFNKNPFFFCLFFKTDIKWIKYLVAILFFIILLLLHGYINHSRELQSAAFR